MHPIGIKSKKYLAIDKLIHPPSIFSANPWRFFIQFQVFQDWKETALEEISFPLHHMFCKKRSAREGCFPSISSPYFDSSGRSNSSIVWTNVISIDIWTARPEGLKGEKWWGRSQGFYALFMNKEYWQVKDQEVVSRKRDPSSTKLFPANVL